MNKKKSIISLIMALSITSISLGGYNTACAKYSTKVKNAYTKFLSKHNMKKISDDDFENAAFETEDKSYVNSFALYDLDKDGVPELITETPVNFRWYIVRVYTVRGGKVKACKFDDGEDAVFDNNATANGAYEYHVCKNSHIHNSYSGSMANETDIYSLKNGKLSKVDNCSDKQIKLKYYNNTKKGRKKIKNL